MECLLRDRNMSVKVANWKKLMGMINSVVVKQTLATSDNGEKLRRRVNA